MRRTSIFACLLAVWLIAASSNLPCDRVADIHYPHVSVEDLKVLARVGSLGHQVILLCDHGRREWPSIQCDGLLSSLNAVFDKRVAIPESLGGSGGDFRRFSTRCWLLQCLNYKIRGAEHVQGPSEGLDQSSVDHVMPLIQSLAIGDMSLEYQYAALEEEGQAGINTYFKFDGVLFVADLQLQLAFEFRSGQPWTFTACLKPQDSESTIGQILSNILGEDDLDLPTFLANSKVQGGSENLIRLGMQKSSNAEGMFQLVSTVAVGDLELTFAQIHLQTWGENIPSKRLVKVALTALPNIDVPLVGNLTQPFDEMYLMWVDQLNLSLVEHPLVPKDKVQEKADTDVLVTAGSHFAIIMQTTSGVNTCVLDYEFKKASTAVRDNRLAEIAPVYKSDSDGESSSAPLKKTIGPLSISNIGLKYADQQLHITLDATLELGPLAFSLLGFSLNLMLKGLQDVSLLSAASELCTASWRHGGKQKLEVLEVLGKTAQARPGGNRACAMLLKIRCPKDNQSKSRCKGRCLQGKRCAQMGEKDTEKPPCCGHHTRKQSPSWLSGSWSQGPKWQECKA
ncbi:hypothetical protein QBC38DRAFT_517353 [Podospora fimiseda]|uniref:DUF6603 domain-containing protein n=1 Tax=Podospora fimiseda TaxID=252190 RepID=A0AAN7BH24_9PEZI|nr:hypothetical protein QBC38DRAFT_517353 [Podospora fimiseda]